MFRFQCDIGEHEKQQGDALDSTSILRETAPYTVDLSSAHKTRPLYQRNSTGGGILAALYHFCQAVERMGRAVLIPSYLRDVTLPADSVQPCDCGSGVPRPSAYECYDFLKVAKSEIEYGQRGLEQSVTRSELYVTEAAESTHSGLAGLIKLCRRDSCLSLDSEPDASRKEGSEPSECSDCESAQQAPSDGGMAASLSYHMRALILLLKRLSKLAEAIVSAYNQTVLANGGCA